MPCMQRDPILRLYLLCFIKRSAKLNSENYKNKWIFFASFKFLFSQFHLYVTFVLKSISPLLKLLSSNGVFYEWKIFESILETPKSTIIIIKEWLSWYQIKEERLLFPY